jgi:hypothetical protein
MGNLVSAITGGGLFKAVKGIFKGPDVPEMSKQVIQAPSSAIDTADKEEDEVNLGSDRAKDSGKRKKGRRQLMATQTTSTSSASNETTGSSTGLQL